MSNGPLYGRMEITCGSVYYPFCLNVWQAMAPASGCRALKNVFKYYRQDKRSNFRWLCNVFTPAFLLRLICIRMLVSTRLV